MRDGHAEACRSQEFTGGIPFPCDCGKDRHDAEIANIQHRLSAEQRRAAALDEKCKHMRDALSEIIHLDDDATLADAREVAYSAMRRSDEGGGGNGAR